MRNRFFAALFAVACLCGAGCSGSSQAQRPATAGNDTPVPADPLEAACREGNVKSCLSAGQSRQSRGNDADAVEFFGYACELGEAVGCVYAGRVMIEGDVAAAAQWFERGCDAGDGTSCYAAGVAWSGLYGGEANPQRSAEAYRRGCDAGLAEACGNYAESLSTGAGVEANLAEAARLRIQACDAGDGTSCIVLASELRAAQDMVAAEARLAQACETDGRGCTLLGIIHVDAQDAEGARGWFERGCMSEFPDADSCGWYGWHVWSGFGGPKSDPEGRALLDSSCEAESAVGCTFRGVVEASSGQDPQRYLARACEIDAEQCVALKRQFESLSTRK